MAWHPDRNPNNRLEAEERFKAIANAYRALSDATSRAEYDEWLGRRANESEGAGLGGAARQASSADAEQVFFEQMMDLGFDLAARGFNEATILKTLVSLECPEAIAKAVANSVVRANQRSSRAEAKAPDKEPEEKDEGHKQPEYAGFWRRVAAYSCDSLVLFIPIALLSFGLEALFGALDPTVLSFLAVALLVFLYDGFMISRRGATYGRQYLGVEVVRKNGENLSFWRAGFRGILRVLTLLLWGVLFLIQPFTSRRQALHDFAVGSVVLRTSPGKSPALILTVLLALPVLGILAAVALPAYQDYTMRSKVSEGVIVLQSLKGPATKYISAKQAIPRSIESLGVPIQKTPIVDAVGIDDNSGAIFVRFGPDTGSVAGKKVILMPYMTEKGFEWACGSVEIPKRMLPSSCNREEFPQGLGEYFAEVAKSAEEQEWEKTLTQVARRYPALNEESPSFNQVLVDRVIARTKAYVDRGVPRSEALRKAASDVDQEAGLAKYR